MIARITTFPVARRRLEWQPSTPVRLPDDSCSMLCGAFGYALRTLAECVNGGFWSANADQRRRAEGFNRARPGTWN